MNEITGSHRKLRVVVLMGGTSHERDVSLSTGRMITSALDTRRYEVSTTDTRDLLSLAESRPDVVVIALHGHGGEDGTIQGFLETLAIPYTGSGVLASALAMDKGRAKRILRDSKVPVVESVEVFNHPRLALNFERGQGALIREWFGLPVFVKPNAEGSTFGCTLVETPEALWPAVKNALCYDDRALVEPYLRGVELTVGVLEDEAGRPQALPVIEIVPKSKFYDYESKYATGGSEHIIPARLTPSRARRAQAHALTCHETLGCRGMSRTDMILQGKQLFILETNTIPGMTPTSLLPQAADYAGIPFPTLLDRLIASALRVHREKHRDAPVESED